MMIDLLCCVGVTLKQRNGLKKDELELQLYGFIEGYIPTLAPLELSDIKQINKLDLFYFYTSSDMKSSHPNPQRDGYNLEGSLTRISNHKITMIKCRQEIIAYTFRNYTRQRIRQLLSYPFNDNMSSYQENLSLCQRVLAVGFLTLVITRHTCGEIFGYAEFAFDFH